MRLPSSSLSSCPLATSFESRRHKNEKSFDREMMGPIPSPRSPRYNFDRDDNGYRSLSESRRRKGRLNMILYSSIVALLLILLVNHRHINRYVDPSARQLSSARSSTVRSASGAHRNQHPHRKSNNHHHHRTSSSREDDHSLRQEFESWVKNHRRNYGSKEEKENRWQIWKENHLRTLQKNSIHGPCKHTKRNVFGSNHFKDLSPQEFRRKFLTGYGGPLSSTVLNSTQMYLTHQHPAFIPNRHETVHTRYMDHVQNMSWFEPETRSLAAISPEYFTINATTSCSWYQVKCWIQTMVGTYSNAIGSIGKHREPKFNSSSYPTAVDWRQVGAVTDIHTQGSCGACWAITGKFCKYVVRISKCPFLTHHDFFIFLQRSKLLNRHTISTLVNYSICHLRKSSHVKLLVKCVMAVGHKTHMIMFKSTKA
jgi:hypothetical protein